MGLMVTPPWSPLTVSKIIGPVVFELRNFSNCKPENDWTVVATVDIEVLLEDCVGRVAIESPSFSLLRGLRRWGRQS